MEIKRTLVVLLLVCFLVSLTAIVGSASNGSPSKIPTPPKNETKVGGSAIKVGGSGMMNATAVSTSWTPVQLNQYTAAKESFYNTGVLAGQTKGATDGFNDRTNNKKYDADPKPYHTIASGTDPVAQGKADGYNEGFDNGYLGNDGYEYGWDRAGRQIGSSGSNSGSSSGSIQSCQGPMPNCRNNRFPACVYTDFGSVWRCVRV